MFGWGDSQDNSRCRRDCSRFPERRYLYLTENVQMSEVVGMHGRNQELGEAEKV